MTEMSPTSPVPGRPHIPDYGVPEGPDGMLPWTYVTDRLVKAMMYWVATAGPKGEPHAVPYWGAFVDDVLYFETAPTTKGGRNLRFNPAVVIHLISGEQVVIVEGLARTAVPGATLLAKLQDAYRPKYEGYFPPSADKTVIWKALSKFSAPR